MKRKTIRTTIVGIVLAALASPGLVYAAGGDDGSHSSGEAIHFGLMFAMFAVILIAGKLGNYIERWGIPAVLGELMAGIALSAAGYFGWGFIEQIRQEEVIAFVASLGSLLLLFSIGLEANMHEIKKVGRSAVNVALIGVVAPFILGAYILGPLFYGDLDPEIKSNAHLFLGASLVATSVGITSSVLRSLKISRTRAASTFLGATVIDDVLGLIILAIVSALVQGGELTAPLLLELTLKSFGFLAGALIIGSIITKPLSRSLSKVHTGIGMKLTFALGLALIFGYLAELFGLEAIIGAFAAGLLLDAVHFESFADPEVIDDLKALEFKSKKDRERVLRVINKHKHLHIEDLINSIGLVFIPAFFVYIGLQVEIESLLEPKLYLIAGIIALTAIVAKAVAGLAAKGSFNEKMLVGFSMVPRGEVGLIFASTGRALGVLNDELFSVIILVVIMTTFLGPAAVKHFAKKVYPDKF